MLKAPLFLDPRALKRGQMGSCRPSLFRMGVAAEVSALESLLASNEVLFVHDTVPAQLEELIETRVPERKLSREEVAARVRAQVGEATFAYGTWVHFPWSGRLVHVLPEGEYEELRTSRNRNKITRDEQSRLAKLRVGVAGLSVGQSTAVTLALEGIGGVLRLADFDTLSLSNMNRLRAGVHEIGVNKAVLAAREIFEINPYARVEVFEHGIRDDTIAAFFSDSEPLDLLFEECDDLKMKFRLRQEARKRGIPVLMETSDRGMLDIERFDLEPARPMFHSLVPELDPEHLAGLTTQEKVPIVLDKTEVPTPEDAALAPQRAAVREVGGGHGLAAPARKQIAAASAVGLLTMPGRAHDIDSTRRTYFAGGTALQRVWLLATKLGLAFHPMTAILYLFARLEQGGSGLDDGEKRESANCAHAIAIFSS
jgi:molybdopterin/thiamine biosynthesis adenylyltransferase